VQDIGISAGEALRPVFDTLWNAYGYEKSENYDNKGNRIQ
jgi:hypothetical protein